MNKNLLVVIIVLILLSTAGYFSYFVFSKAPDKNIELMSPVTALPTVTKTTAVPKVTRTTKTTAPKKTTVSTPKTTAAPKATTPAPTTPKATTPTTPTPSPIASGLPDLIVEKISTTQTSPKINDPVTEILITVKNKGTGNVTTSTPVYLTIESDAGFFGEITSPLSILAGKTAVLKFKPFADTEETFDAGEIAIDAYVNADESIEESDIENNLFSGTIEFVE